MNGKKPLWIVLIVLASLIALVALVLVGAICYFRFPIINYYTASDKAFVIPEITNDYVPQGMHYCSEERVFLLSGYSASGKASPLIVTDVNGKILQKVTLKNKDGTPFLGHGGGVAKYRDFVYVAGDDARLYIFSYTDVMAAQYGTGISAVGEFSLQASESDYLIPAFVTVRENTLVVGEFYREKEYPTPESHHMTTQAGDAHYALAVRFTLSESAEFGIEPVPTLAYSLPNQVQGMTFSEDGSKVYLSTSWALAFSHILEYDMNALERQGDISVLGQSVPLYAMDSAALIKDYKIAPMSEEMVMLGGRLYVLCESASDKYIFGRLTGGKWCYATELEKMK